MYSNTDLVVNPETSWEKRDLKWLTINSKSLKNWLLVENANFSDCHGQNRVERHRSFSLLSSDVDAD